MINFSEFLLNENLEELKKKFKLSTVEKAKPGDSVNSIGFSEADQKWYGWSHRAVCGFKIGDMIFEPNFGDDKTPFVKHGSKECKTLADCKKAAIAFADHVS